MDQKANEFASFRRPRQAGCLRLARGRAAWLARATELHGPAAREDRAHVLAPPAPPERREVVAAGRERVVFGAFRGARGDEDLDAARALLANPDARVVLQRDEWLALLAAEGGAQLVEDLVIQKIWPNPQPSGDRAIYLLGRQAPQKED